MHELYFDAQAAECYNDIVSALSADEGHPEAVAMKQSIDSTAGELKDAAVRLTLLGRHRDALTKLTKAISINPPHPDLHILRYESTCWMLDK
jgi:hypothetical protein